MNEPVQRASRAVIPNDDNTQKFLTTRRYPIYYLAITKCASTYLKNVFYLLDNDQVHPAPERIHDHGHDLLRADRTPRWMIRRSPYAFTVVRGPVSRFLSFYFDKIHGVSPQNFSELRQNLSRQLGISLDPDLSADGHIENCLKLVEWVGRNLSHQTPEAVNPHWRPQVLRIRTVEAMKPTFLTVNRLDEGLLHMLGPMIPDLEGKLARVRNRNSIRYPVPKDAMLDPTLVKRIETLYADDLALFERVQARRANLGAPPGYSTGRGISVLTTHRFRLNAVVQPKAGSTFVRNLFYRLDHGVTHPDPRNIDADGCLLYRRKQPDRIAEEISFAVIRNPVDRFFSLYFDKVWASQDTAFSWIPEALATHRRFHDGEDLSLAEHHDNCCRLLGFLETRFRKEPRIELNPHWRPQSERLQGLQGMGFRALTLDGLTEQLRKLAGPKVRDFSRHLDQLAERNATTKPVSTSELASPWIMERLQTLYEDDIALYNRVTSERDAQEDLPYL